MSRIVFWFSDSLNSRLEPRQVVRATRSCSSRYSWPEADRVVQFGGLGGIGPRNSVHAPDDSQRAPAAGCRPAVDPGGPVGDQPSLGSIQLDGGDLVEAIPDSLLDRGERRCRRRERRPRRQSSSVLGERSLPRCPCSVASRPPCGLQLAEPFVQPSISARTASRWRDQGLQPIGGALDARQVDRPATRIVRTGSAPVQLGRAAVLGQQLQRIDPVAQRPAADPARSVTAVSQQCSRASTACSRPAARRSCAALVQPEHVAAPVVDARRRSSFSCRSLSLIWPARVTARGRPRNSPIVVDADVVGPAVELAIPASRRTRSPA